MLHWSDSGTHRLPNYCMWLQYSVLTVTQWQRGRWAKTRAVQESVACHRAEVSLHSAEVSSYLCDTLVIRYKSLLKDVQERRVNGSLKQTHTSLSRRDDNSIGLWGGEKERLTAAEIEGWRGMQRKTEKGKQFFCVSRQFSVVQFLLLSSTGNNYQEGWLPGQLALFSL